MGQRTVPTTKYIAFLRAINVGGHTVKMDQLRALFESLGYSNVTTFIASGNVIFDSPEQKTDALENDIEAHLQTSLGYQVKTFIRSVSELAAIAQYQPFTASEADGEVSTLYIGFLPAHPNSEARQKLMAIPTELDDFHFHQREIYWRRRGRISDSTFSGGLLEKTLGMPATLRNSNTIRRLATKHPAP